MTGILALEYIGIINVAQCIRQRIERRFLFRIVGNTENNTDNHKANENGHDKFADGLRFLKEAGADDAVLTLRSLEAFEKAANGKATKIIIPSEIQGIAGLVKSITEVAADDENKQA